MNRSENIGELIAALAKAQTQFGAAVKDTPGMVLAGRSYKYADLAANIGAVRPALNANGIALMQFNESDLERQTASVTTALHHGEQFISITAEAPATGRNGFDVQSIGAAWTYLRRYTLQAICGLASEDDDGEALAGADNKPIQRKASTPVISPPQPPQSSATSHKSEPVEEVNFNLVGDLLECVIKGVTEKTTKAGKPYVAVTVNGRIDGFNWASNWHQSLTPVLKGAIGQPCILKISRKMSEDGKSIQFLNIEDVLYVNGTDYENGLPKPKEEANV